MTAQFSRVDAADIQTSPLNAAVAALFDDANPETLAAACEALVDAVDADALAFLDAVDRAQNLATACGAVRAIGQDAVQAIMAEAFKRCRVHHRSSAEPQPQYERAADSTVEALMFSLRERGAGALSERAFLDRLANLSSDQVRDVIKRLVVLRSRCPNITDELLFKLGSQL